jgi:hypothetical protein
MQPRESALAVALAIMVFSGCAGAHGYSRPAGGPSSDYTQGVLTAMYDADLLKAYEASVKAMTDLAMTIRRSEKDETGGTILATRPDDMKSVVVALKAQGRDGTLALVKVGREGDEGYSRVLAKRIGARLKG